jgi:cytochrome c
MTLTAASASAQVPPKRANPGRANPGRVLVFSKTKGWKHTSIPFGIAAIQKLGRENNFRVDTTKNADYFNDDSLKHYQAVIWLSTTGNVLNQTQQAAFERYIQAGGGYLGIHAAADTEYDWPWYNKLAGGYFASHPNNSNVRKATVDVIDKNHPSTSMLPDHWERTDEWYNYRSLYSDLHVLANLDENTYEGGINGSNHPIAWYHEFDGGRAYYTGGGHEDSSFSEPLFVQHLLGALNWVMGSGKPLDYSKSYAVVMPEENRFVKTVLVNDLNEPMEVAVADDGRVFFTERSGNLSVYNSKTNTHKLVHKFDVPTKQGHGVQGITLDPKFSTNHWLYIYYTPQAEKDPFYNLSRFVVKDDNTLDLASEKVLLKVPSLFEPGSHHGGSIAFDKEGNLYLSTGDHTNPFPSNGYAPIDARPDHPAADARGTAANTADLRGKILRIRPQADGTYTIPEGNLFPKGTEKTRPEIYTMGLRNPYRIALNPKSSVLYWGEIGPDAGKDSSTLGPRGYDEFNQAKKAGNFGWPLFIGNSQPYGDLDFATNAVGPRFDPKDPVNNSPKSTGLQHLPPTNPAMIWYPYAASKEFPELGQGGRSAMAGEFYTYDNNSTSKAKFPQYYNGALFIFDWMRNWVMAVRVDKDDNYVRTEPFMASSGDFRRPIDLAFGKDGVMYMLEYGSVYGADNDDARLVKIEYNTGNRAPIARAAVVDSAAAAIRNARSFLTSDGRNAPVIREAIGQAPLRVKFTGRGTDLDDEDRLTYQWLFDGKTVGATQPNATHTYTQPGVYNAILKVTDQTGKVGMDTIMVKVGNAKPEVEITTTGNKSFFWPGKPFDYAVKVTDKEDGKVDPKRVKLTYEYSAQPSTTPAASQQGHQNLADIGNGSLGKTLVANSDCKACHTIDKPSVGPTFLAVADRYKGQTGSVERLARKIIEGGGGNWSKDHLMSAHPQIPPQDAQEMVKYIFSLTDAHKQKALALEGSLPLAEHKPEEARGQYMLVASYTDKGGKVVGPLTSTDIVTLRNANVKTVNTDAYVGFPRFGNRLSPGSHKAYVLLKNVDMTTIKSLTYEYSSLNKDGTIDVRLDSYAGPIVSRAPYKATGGFDKVQKVTGTLDKPFTGRHDVYIVVMKPEKPNENIIQLNSIEFNQ